MTYSACLARPGAHPRLAIALAVLAAGAACDSGNLTSPTRGVLRRFAFGRRYTAPRSTLDRPRLERFIAVLTSPMCEKA